MQLAPMRTPSPSTTVPSKMQLMSISTSRPHSRLPRTSRRAGSMTVTPASVRLRAMLRWWMRSSSASWVLLLTPRVSSKASGWVVTTSRPSATAMAMMSVR
jgi:hypothetical protein